MSGSRTGPPDALPDCSGPPNGPVRRPARPNGLPANAVGRQNVHVPASAVNRPTKPNAGQANLANRPGRTPGRPPAIGPTLVGRLAIVLAQTSPRRPEQMPARPANARPQHDNPRHSRAWTGPPGGPIRRSRQPEPCREPDQAPWQRWRRGGRPRSPQRLEQPARPGLRKV